MEDDKVKSCLVVFAICFFFRCCFVMQCGLSYREKKNVKIVVAYLIISDPRSGPRPSPMGWARGNPIPFSRRR